MKPIPYFLSSRAMIAFTFILFSNIAFSQITKPTQKHYPSGEIYWKGYYLIDTSGRNLSAQPTGLWTYWYENGARKAEIIQIGSDQRYINMWLPDGKQILKDGNGIFVSTDPFNHFELDSCIYNIVDSFMTGKFISYKKIEGQDSFGITTGQYVKNKRYGTFTYTSTSVVISNFVDDKETGAFFIKTLEGKVLTEGTRLDGFHDGRWTWYNENGLIQKIRNFNKGAIVGQFIDYHENGKIKNEGQYTLVSGWDKSIITDPVTGEQFTKDKFDNAILARNGTWNSYDSTGRLIKSETFYNEIVRD